MTATRKIGEEVMKMGTTVIIGGGTMGMRTAVTLRSLLKDERIVIIEKTPIASWAGCPIPYYISGRLPESSVILDSPDDIRKRGIELYENHEVVDIDPDGMRVKVKGGKIDGWMDYDNLVLGLGAIPRRIPILDEIEAENIFHITHALHGLKLRKFIDEEKPNKVLIVGGGYVGLEMVENLSELGMKISLVEKMEDILPRLPKRLRKKVYDKLKEREVEYHLSTVVEDVEIVGRLVKRVKLSNSRTLDVDLIVVSVGVLPNTKMLKNTKAEFGPLDSLKTNEYMEVMGLEKVYAGGDMVCVKNLITGKEAYYPLGDVANKHGIVTARRIAGKSDLVFKGAIGTSLTGIFGLQIGFTGLTKEEAEKEGFSVETMNLKAFTGHPKMGETTSSDLEVIYDFRDGRILGAFMVGEKCVAQFIDLISTFITMRMKAQEIFDVDYAYAPIGSTVWNPGLLFARKFYSGK
ncbi:MAG TPA: hypothetical protein ENG58_00605 [Thermotogales bacterium]|nr:hypothetical protein [Thermotogales bacterium]